MSRKFQTKEEALLALVQGREEGLDFFFAQHYTALTYFAFRLVHDGALAEDLVSEAYVKLWNNRASLSEQGSVKAWLYRSVRNAAIDEIRKARRVKLKQAQLQLLQEGEEFPVLHRMIESETLQEILRSLQFLPPKCSQVFQLFYLQGKTYDEIAEVLRISPHTARNQKIRALRILQTRFGFLLLLLFAFLYR